MEESVGRRRKPWGSQENNCDENKKRPDLRKDGRKVGLNKKRKIQTQRHG